MAWWSAHETKLTACLVVVQVHPDTPASRKERMTLAQFAIARKAGKLMETAESRMLMKKETRLLDLLLENVERYERMEMESDANTSR